MMAIAGIAAAPVSASEVAPSPRADDANAAQFAQIFATVMNAAAKPAAAAKAPDGTSELEQRETADDAETGSAGVSKSDEALDPATLAAVTSATASPNAVVRSLAALDPQLQEKLARVINRVRQETGHDVSVSETYRSQARQNKLFAQGRSAEGPVVTWTQRSKHTEGRAVDVVLDNGSAGGDAYRALQRIANEEGLGTLGPRDPGHLELRGRVPRANGDATPRMPIEPADATGRGEVSVARLAQVAKVAEVKPTMVARPAHVAQVTPATPIVPYGVTLAAREPHVVVSTASVAGASGVESAARAERVMAARDSAPARALSQITMSVDAGNGASDRVQVSMRGSALSATIDTTDTRSAQAMNARADELARALDKQGVELAAFHARGSESYQPSRFDRGDAWQQQKDQQERHQSRQEQQQQRDERRQQREQRGGRR